jgi:hypothetical protein
MLQSKKPAGASWLTARGRGGVAQKQRKIICAAGRNHLSIIRCSPRV